MDGFSFPTNVKQIGSIGEGLRIYIEDYAYSYLQQYIGTQGHETKLAFLVGRSMVIDSQDVLFISGVVRGLHAEPERGMLTFTGKSFEHALKDIGRYFGGLELVGWMQSQPGFGLRLLPSTEEYHFKAFPDKTHVCMIMDSDEKINAFYIQSADGARLVEAKGYFIYYDKNRGMHEYMLDNKTTRIKVLSAEGKGVGIREPAADEPLEEFGGGEMLPGEVAVQRIRRNYLQRNGVEPARVTKEDRRAVASSRETEENPRYVGRELLKAGSIMSSSSGGTPRYSQPPSQRRVVNLLMSFSAVLLVVSLALGAGMLQNIERIVILEQQMGDLTASHRNLLADVTNAARPVFADNHNNDTAANVHVNAETSVLQNQADEAILTVAEEPVMALGTPLHSPVNIEELITQLQQEAANQPNEPEPLPEPPQNRPHEAALPPPHSATSHEVLLPPIPWEYVVEPGDTLSFISTLFFGSPARVADIMELNDITNPDAIMVGDILMLPRRY